MSPALPYLPRRMLGHPAEVGVEALQTNGAGRIPILQRGGTDSHGRSSESTLLQRHTHEAPVQRTMSM